MRKIIKMFMILIGGLISLILLVALIVWIKSPGKTDLIVDQNGKPIATSISSVERIELGGIEQYLIIRGADSTKPVMLFLHGGPGSPEIAFMKETNTAIEKDYVMVYWEQRGAGKSYSKNIPVETMNMKQFIADTRELSQILAKRFKKDKIYLMGHSWGSLLGIMTVNQYPELYHAYFGIGQVCDQYKGEKIAFEWLKQQAKQTNNKEALESLSSLSFPDSTANIDEWVDYLMIQRNYINQFGGGVTCQIHGMWPLIKMVLNAKEYTFKEKMNFGPASLFSLKSMWLEVVNTNLFNKIDSLQIPVYFFQGVHDYTTPYPIAREFYEHVKAPKKEFFTFENSAHSPLMEEVEKFNDLLRERVVEK